MLKIWGILFKNNKIIKDEVVYSDIEGGYQENLKVCITELCYKFDIPKPYWLPSNLNEYNRRNKTSFTKDNFMEELDFDKFAISDITDKK
jgi:hypothetical protein